MRCLFCLVALFCRGRCLRWEHCSGPESERDAAKRGASEGTGSSAQRAKRSSRARLDALHQWQAPSCRRHSNSEHGYKVQVPRRLQAGKVLSTGRDREPPGLREPGREPLVVSAGSRYLSPQRARGTPCPYKVVAQCTPYHALRPDAEQ